MSDRGALFLASVESVSDVRRRGLGGAIVRSIVEDATRRRNPVRLRPNPARRLYERRGFRVVGETATHVEMLHEP